MKYTITALSVLAVIFCPLNPAVGRPPSVPIPPTKPDHTADDTITQVERPIAEAGYFYGTAVETKARGETGILIKYKVDPAATDVLHKTQWIYDLIPHPLPNPPRPTNINDSWLDITGSNESVKPGKYLIQFWAQTAFDVPPQVMQVTVEQDKTTTIEVSYENKGCKFLPINLGAEAGSVGNPVNTSISVQAGYGKLEFDDITGGHSTSWSIDGGGWRSTGVLYGPFYQGAHTIQFRANTVGDTPPATLQVTIIPLKKSVYPIQYQ